VCACVRACVLAFMLYDSDNNAASPQYLLPLLLHVNLPLLELSLNICPPECMHYLCTIHSGWLCIIPGTACLLRCLRRQVAVFPRLIWLQEKEGEEGGFWGWCLSGGRRGPRWNFCAGVNAARVLERNTSYDHIISGWHPFTTVWSALVVITSLDAIKVTRLYVCTNIRFLHLVPIVFLSVDITLYALLFAAGPWLYMHKKYFGLWLI